LPSRAKQLKAVAPPVRRPNPPPRGGRRITTLRAAFAFAWRRAGDVRLPQVAASLTFTTVLSLVPVLAIALSILAVFPVFADFRAMLDRMVFHGLLPDSIESTIPRFLNEFAGKAARLTAAGIVFLTLAALSMALTIDRILNDVWRVRTRRPLAQRLLIYWALITVGPLVLAASLTATSYLFSISAGLVSRSSLVAVLDLLPLVLGGLTLAAVYVYVPNRVVRWRDALFGGFIASGSGELLKHAFAVYIARGNYTSIYGAFAALPLFLIWVYLSWLVTLFGAVITAMLPALRHTRFADDSRAGNTFVTAVAVLRELLIARLAGDDDGRVDVEALGRRVRSPLDDVDTILEVLEQLGYVSRIDGPHAGKWLLTCDVARVNLVPLFSRLAVDPQLSLVEGDQAPLARWMDDGLAAAWIDRPIASLVSERS